MHHTNGVLEDSGRKEDGPHQSAQPRDRTLFGPSRLPDESELTFRSIALRQTIYGNGKDNVAKHYVRKPHNCVNCPQEFSSKSALREHMFERHSY